MKLSCLRDTGGQHCKPSNFSEMGMLRSKLEARQILKHFKRVGDEGGEAKKHPLQIKNKQSQAKNLNKTATDTNYFLTVNHSSYLEQGNIQ